MSLSFGCKLKYKSRYAPATGNCRACSQSTWQTLGQANLLQHQQQLQQQQHLQHSNTALPAMATHFSRPKVLEAFCCPLRDEGLSVSLSAQYPSQQPAVCLAGWQAGRQPLSVLGTRQTVASVGGVCCCSCRSCCYLLPLLQVAVAVAALAVGVAIVVDCGILIDFF